MTLEQKLTWAEERGLEPPTHVRLLVETRRSQAMALEMKKAKGGSCCESRSKHRGDSAASRPCCEEHRTPRHEDESSSKHAPHVRWLSIVQAQNCRGVGPAALQFVDFSVVPETGAMRVTDP